MICIDVSGANLDRNKLNKFQSGQFVETVCSVWQGLAMCRHDMRGDASMRRETLDVLITMLKM